MRKKEDKMRECYAVEIVTPKKVRLNGLWFGAKRPKRIIIWVHGLGSSLFSKLGIIEILARNGFSVLTFNNRGHDTVSRIARLGETKVVRPQFGGSAHEKFEECVDDIEGAIKLARRAGSRNIFLAGHSTGCQKAIYWASKRNGGRGVRGIILLAPISDYSGALFLHGKKKVARAAVVARALVHKGKKSELLPSDVWHETIDAQRFLSLYSGKSTEEIFTYSRKDKIPRALKAVRRPILTLLAGKDEYADRPAKEIDIWFKQNVANRLSTKIIGRASHGFRGSEMQVATLITKWINLR